MTMAQFVKSMFTAPHIDEENTIPDDFEAMDAVKLINAIATYRRKNYHEQIKCFPWGDATNTNRLLQKFTEAQPLIKGVLFEKALDALDINFDYSVMGSDAFMPKLLPNGALLFRNHHRVVAINDQPSSILSVPNTQLQKELLKVTKANPAEDESNTPRVFMIHRDTKTGDIMKTRTVPKMLSEVGQTLVFISNECLLDASTLLADSDISDVASDSRTGYAVLRTYKDKTYIHAMYRASDDYDTILEEFNDVYFGEWEEWFTTDLTQDYMGLKKKVSSRAQDFMENTEIKRPHSNSVMSYYFDKLTTSVDSYTSYANRKAQQIGAFTSLFHADPKRPPTYSSYDDRLWSLSESFEHKVLFIECNERTVGAIKQFSKKTTALINTLVDEIAIENATVYMLTENELQSWHDKDNAHALSSPEVKTFLKQREKELIEKLKTEVANNPDSDPAELESELLDCAEERLYIIVQSPSGLFDLEDLNQRMKSASATFESGLSLYIPACGFSQGYDNGDYDTGNCNTLLTEGQCSDDDHDDDYDDEENDE